MLPLLVFASDGQEHSMAEAVEKLSDKFRLTQEEREELLPSGTQFVIANRIGWARTYMKKAGLLADPRRSHFQITDRGRELLKKRPSSISTKDLKQYDEFNEFQRKSIQKGAIEDQGEEHSAHSTPEEALEYGYQKLTENLSDELLEKIMTCSPAFFERLVIELLVKMGYGGSLKEAASIVGKSGDAGIDGIIKEDKLGLDAIYVQAKRWENVVGRPEIQKFAGALLGQKARKGIFITTSGFTKEATDYVNGIEAKIVLIDGAKLIQLMIENNLGISTVRNYEIKRVDSDYFDEE
ncbi:MAG: restriction endonuclease [Rectinemataceae bacterium]|jgi:restriction system protein